MSGEGLLYFIVGIPAIVLGGSVAGGYVAHRYSPTYLATGLGAIGGGIATAVAIPLVVAPLALSAIKSFSTPTPSYQSWSDSKTSPPSGSTL